MIKYKLWKFRDFHAKITGTEDSLPKEEIVNLLKYSEYDSSIQHCSWIDPESIIKLEFRRIYNGKDIRYPGGWDGEKFRLLAESIRLNGVMHPITVYSSLKVDGYIVCRGCHRAVCCMYLKIGIPAHILEPQV